MNTPTTGRTRCRHSSTRDPWTRARSATLPRMYYNRSGEPISLEEWGALLSSDLYRIVEQSWLGPYYVSTVWLGLDHGIMSEVPLIFETMVFGDGPGLRHDMLCDRYPTEEAARQGHHEIITLIRATTDVSE